MEISRKVKSLLRRHIALPTDHGSWVFLFSPLLIGLFAGERWSAVSVYVIIAALAAFLVRQPTTIAVKVHSGRRPMRDLPTALFWTAVYGLTGLVALLGLLANGYAHLLILAVPGVPVFAWHLYLVSRRAERRQMGVEAVATGVLGLAAPAAYWTGIGKPDPMGWWLWALVWVQSAASIVYVYLRLEQRELPVAPDLHTRIKMGTRALLLTTFNFLAVTAFTLTGSLPRLLLLPYTVQFAETLYGTLRPAIGLRPTSIGVRQLIISTLFTLLFIITWRL